MGKIRTIKPELFRHEGLFDAEQATKLPLRLGFIGLIDCCDGEGRFKWRPRQLKLDIFPYDELDMQAILIAFVEWGFIQGYIVNGIAYGWIPSWKHHQRINAHEASSQLPAIDEASSVNDLDKIKQCQLHRPGTQPPTPTHHKEKQHNVNA